MWSRLQALDGHVRYINDCVVEPRLRSIDQGIYNHEEESHARWQVTQNRLHDEREMLRSLEKQGSRNQEILRIVRKLQSDPKEVNITSSEGADAKTVAEILTKQLLDSGYELIEEADNA